jgi:hypothetical protein
MIQHDTARQLRPASLGVVTVFAIGIFAGLALSELWPLDPARMVAACEQFLAEKG